MKNKAPISSKRIPRCLSRKTNFKIESWEYNISTTWSKVVYWLLPFFIMFIFDSELAIAQCTFTDEQKQKEYEALVAIYNANPNNTFDSSWADLANGSKCEVCDIPANKVACDENGYIVRLQIGNRNLSVLPPEIGDLVNLTHLYITNNQFQSLPAEIGNLVNLLDLSAYNNELQGLPAEIGNLANLTSLSLSGNELQSLPAEIGNLASLTEISITRNKLQSLPAEIGNLSSLTILSFSVNELQSLPAEIGNLLSLTSCLLYTSPSPRDATLSRMPSSA